MFPPELGGGRMSNNVRFYKNSIDKISILMQKLIDYGELVGEYIVMACSLLMVTTVVFSVLSRYFLRYPLTWSEEFSRYMLVMITFVGGGLALKRGLHAYVDFAVRALPDGFRWIVNIIQHIMTLVFAILFTIWSIKLVLSPTILYQVSPAIRLPMFYIYGIMPLAFGFMVLVEVNSLLKIIFRK